MNPSDDSPIRIALELAHGVVGLTDPNPRVGCVITSSQGLVLGQGATQAPGQAHAEVMALRDAQARGHDVRGATAWVTLEPCAHYGRTPPCCDALIAAGISRCVVALQDPYPPVAGAGLARMRAAGIQVDLLEDASLTAAAHELNVGFFSRVQRGRPWVRVKLAMSLDGRSALLNGQSQWITGAEARADGHAWRRRASAVLTGIGTVLADNPRMDVRAVPTPRQPLRIVLDSKLRMPDSAAILKPPGNVLIVARQATPANVSRLQRCGAEVWNDEADAGAHTLRHLLDRLGGHGINELHVEAGPALSGALLNSGLVDEVLAYVAPVFLGPGQPTLHLPELQSLDRIDRFVWRDTAMLGNDLRIRLSSPMEAKPAPAAAGS